MGQLSGALGTFRQIHDLVAQLGIADLLADARQGLRDVRLLHFAADGSGSGGRLAGGGKPESLRIELEQSRRLRGGITKLEAQFYGGQLGRRPGEKHVTVAYRMEGAGATKGAADLETRDRFADMMHHDERSFGSIAQAQQGLAQRRHGAGVVFVLIVSGVERVEDDDLGGGSLSGGEEVIHSLRCAEQMAGGASVDEQVLIGGRVDDAAHGCQAVDELRDGKFELAD